jgi:hypothetical protein
MLLLAGSTLLGASGQCESAFRDAFFVGIRGAGGSLLDAFFDNWESGDDFVPVTVQAPADRTLLG